MFTSRPELDRFMEKVSPCPITGCWWWTSPPTHDGYGRFRPYRAQKERSNRAAWRLLVGPVPNGLNVLHRCDQPACVNPAHLFLGTMQENANDMVAKGRSRACGARGADHGLHRHPERIARGERHGSAILTESSIKEIRLKHSAGTTRTEIARQYGLGYWHVRDILTRRIWQHVA